MAPRKKVAVPNIPEAPKAPEEKINPIPTKTVEMVKVRMKGWHSPIHHPDQNRWIMNDVDGVDIVLDNWVKCQLKAGLIEIVVLGG